MTSLDAIAGTEDMSVYPTLFSPETLVRKGRCPVSKIAAKDKGRAEPSVASAVLPSAHSMYFEIHGDGPRKVVLITGLNGTSLAWLTHVSFLMGLRNEDGSHRFSCLVLDNRGAGNSDSPQGPYSTSEMANDVITLLDYVGWTAPRQLHIIAQSLGGMIALELASRIHERIVTLFLMVTTAGGIGIGQLTPLKGCIGLARSTFSKSAEEKVPILLSIMYPESFLKGPATQIGRPEITNYEYLAPELLKRLKNQRKQPLIGSLSQMYAAITHSVSAARLAEIDKSVPKIIIMTGDQDHLVRPRNSDWLHKCMPSAEFIKFENTGHIPWTMHPRECEAALLRAIAEGEEKAKVQSSAT